MSLEPLFDAPFIVRIHAFAAMAGFVLGTIQLIAPKGTLPHRMLGLLWMAIMVVVGATSAFIVHPTKPGDPFWAQFSPIHLFTVLTAWALIQGAYFLLKGGPSLKYHRGPFIGLFVGGLIVAGALAVLLPGRVMHRIVFGG